MRKFEEMERDFERSTSCAKAGRSHEYARIGKPSPIFVKGCEVADVFLTQLVECKKCRYSKLRLAMQILPEEK